MAAKGLERFRPVIVLTTAGSYKEAQRLSRMLLREKLAGCISIIPKIESWYWWRGKIERSKEVLLVIKCSRHRVKALARLLKAHHSYEIPELIALPILWGDGNYLKWLEQSMEGN